MQKLEKNKIKLLIILILIVFIPTTKILSKSFDIFFLEPENTKIYYKFESNIKANIYIQNIKSNKDLIFLQNFHDYWNLYLIQKPNNNWCDSELDTDEKNVIQCSKENKLSIKDISNLLKTSIFQDSHKLVYDYANQWTVDPEYIKKNFDKSYYKENPDGSIDIELTLYFKPQSYFYLGLIISGTTLVGCVTYLVVDGIKNSKLKNSNLKTEEIIDCA